MSVQTLYTAATGMVALETKLDVIANNMANINTDGFKRDRANFEDLFYRYRPLPGALDSTGQPTPTGTGIGLGSRVSSTQTDFKQGAFKATGRDLDVALEGNGFFQAIDASTGETLYTRAGNFSRNANGDLVMGSATTGRLIDPSIQFPPDTTGVVISPEGIVQVRQAGTSQLTQLGQIQLAQFVNPQGLEKIGENLYRETDASGSPTVNNPGTDGLGLLRQGYLESSNVEPVHELIDLITTQRAFELNSQVIKAGDEVMQLVSNLRRF